MTEYAWTKVAHTMTFPKGEIEADAERMGLSVDAYLERLMQVCDGIPIEQTLKEKRRSLPRHSLSRQL